MRWLENKRPPFFADAQEVGDFKRKLTAKAVYGFPANQIMMMILN
jgi:hypothetical protein